MIDRAETILHDEFGGVDFWRVRRSMRFAGGLVSIADDYRSKELNSTDELDGITIAEDWRDSKVIIIPCPAGNLIIL